MSTAREILKHKLKIVAELPPSCPSDAELVLITHVRGAGRYRKDGEDMSNLKVLLLQILNQAGQGPVVVKK